LQALQPVFDAFANAAFRKSSNVRSQNIFKKKRLFSLFAPSGQTPKRATPF
jgi:hypothetical protein